MKRTRLWAGMLSSTLLALACSSSSTGGGAVTADQACTDVAKARCTRISACSAIVFAARYADEPTCEAREKADCVSALAAASTGNTPSAVETCASALSGRVDCPSFLANTPPAGCETQVGALADGAPCGFPAQCRSTFCSVGPGTLCGTCAPPPNAGASCATTFCGSGLLCAPTSKTCGLPVAAGAACDIAPCAPGLQCPGLAGSRKCETIVSTAAANQPCGLVNGARVGCAAFGFCKVPAGQTSGTCLAAAADGATCDDTNGPRCATPARCVSGTCQLPSAASCH